MFRAAVFVIRIQKIGSSSDHATDYYSNEGSINLANASNNRYCNYNISNNGVALR